MSSHLQPPAAGHSLLPGIDEVHACLDRMLGATDVGSAPGLTAAVVQVDRAIRRLEALKLKLLAAADRRAVAQEGGFTATESWAAAQTSTNRSAAARQVALARALSTDAGHNTTTRALEDGLVSPAHAAVIVSASRELPIGVTDEQRGAVEAVLVDKARRFSPEQLRRTARRAIETIEPDSAVVDAHENGLVRSEEEAALAKASFTFHDHGDGTTSGHFTVPTAAAGFLRTILDAMTAPRRMHTPEGQSFDWRHRRGRAFAELLEHLPTDHLHEKTAATVVVTLDHHTLTGALKTAGLDTGHTVSAGEARRLACGAGIIPAVLGAGSVALDLGRETRLFTQAQRIAAGLRHDTCAAEGCGRPYTWCELHHRLPWSHGGRTDLANAVPLCHWHHQRVHDHAFTHTWQPDGAIRFRRRTE